MTEPAPIGTPLTASATRVMLLGSGELSKELAISFHRLGLEVHAVDWRAGAPAQQVAHVAHVVDVTDPRAVTALIRKVEPDFIIPEIESIAVDVLEAAEAAGAATVVPSSKAVRLATNREGLRRMASEELGLPTMPFEFASDFTEFELAVGAVGYPCVAKPNVEGPQAKSLYRIDSADDVEPAWAHLCEGEEKTRVIVERLVDFDAEITIIAVRSIDPETGRLATWFCEPLGHLYRHGHFAESWQPMRVSEAALGSARSVAARVTGALGGRGVFNVRLFVEGEDVYFSEVVPRPHDTGLVTMVTQRFSQFDLQARAILGYPIDATLVSPGASSAIISDVASDAVAYRGLAGAMEQPETTVELFGKRGASVGRVMGVVLSTAENIATALDRARAGAEAIRLVPAGGQRGSEASGA
ncbi:hypothetical protein CATYP_09310 [Corynebacterium atypicum]|uniref:ATP-grasp domain-containing protein n=1 Tax=Corynebacterium atypicum TaxID=191610 RepID=A0ABN4DE27_9CORY|nr:formate-dependent phosphoribosylglycinamide formyltransferase [Corynebacterium atypicum]AIG64719.1 hypothetical protein CATYP_09310 [Corynebacterium atypicum]